MPTIDFNVNNVHIVDPQVSALVRNISFDETFYNAIIAGSNTGFLFAFLQSSNCGILNKEEIIDFLNKNTRIIDYLYEAPSVIKEKFGNVKLNLELSFDPELNNDEGELFLNIETNLGVEEAHNKLNEIDKKWFLETVGHDLGKFNLSLDFI